MIFYCPDDGSSLQATGRFNYFLCATCRCIFSVSVAIIKVSGPLLQNEPGEQQPAILPPEFSVEEKPE
jgi:hypothetical protein